jgi:hypothetical protein
VVVWEGPTRRGLLGVHFDWSKQPDQAPTTLQLLYAQEDLWVLDRSDVHHPKHQRRNRIAARSGGQDHRVDDDRPQRRGTRRPGHSMGGAAMGGGMSPMGMGMEGSMGMEYGERGIGGLRRGGYEGMMGSGMMGGGMMGSEGMMGGGMMGRGGGMMGGGMMGDEGMGMMGARCLPAATDPANFRYVDNEYKPLPAQRVRDAMQRAAGRCVPGGRQADARPLRLVVDQRKNPPPAGRVRQFALPVEIRQVRVNPPTGSGGAFGGGMGGYGAAWAVTAA